MDVSEIVTLLGTALGCLTSVGGIGIVFYRKQNRRLKEAEARLAEVSVERAKVDTKAEDWHIVKEQNEQLSSLNAQLIEHNKKLAEINADKEDRHQQDIKDWESRFDSQTDRLRDVQRALEQSNEEKIQLVKDKAALQLERDHYYNWRCYREHGKEKGQCVRRKPKQKVPIKFIPLNDEDRAECSSDCTECVKEIANEN